jgi:aldose 1-epimerase
MYASIVRRKVSDTRTRVWRAMVMRSGLLTAMALAVILGGLIFAVHERGKGHLSKLERKLTPPKTVAQGPYSPPLGGQDAVVLERTSNGNSAAGMPEFVSATMLPGRGMHVLQITARVPSLGAIPLLDSPSLDEAPTVLTGTGADAQGQKSLSIGGAFEVPWANRMGGVPTPDEESMMAVWTGQTMVLPASPLDGDGPPSAVGGLLMKRQASTLDKQATQDGWVTKAVYEAGTFDGHWLSKTEVTTQVEMSSRVMELSVTAKNVGSVSEPLGIGWRPRLALTGGRDQTVLHLPEGLAIEMRAPNAPMYPGLPTGRMLPMTGSSAEFSKPGGARLGTDGISAALVHLKQGYMAQGPAVELHDLKNRFGLRMTMLSPTIRELRVKAPADAQWVEVDPQFNYEDPFGKEWPRTEDTGMVVLQPGESTQWKVRLELFPLPISEGKTRL